MSEVTDWLLGCDPAIRWQVRRDLLEEPEATWRPERARVEHEGWGARLLAARDADGLWAGGAFAPIDATAEEWREVGQPWTATSFALEQLRELGLDPASASAREVVEQVAAARWEHDAQPFWEGEVEECINARLVSCAVWLGVDVEPVVARLVGDQQPDGGWNCERERGSTRSSVHSTINVLEALLLHERAIGGTPATRAARATGEEYLLERGLLRRLSTGEPLDEALLRITHPSRYRYDVLRGLDHFRAADRPDPRLAGAVDRLRSLRRGDGRWAVEAVLPGRTWLHFADPGDPSPWVTLKALRVLRWWDAHHP